MSAKAHEYFDLSVEELRAVTRFALASAMEIAFIFREAMPEDDRVDAALDAARAFASGAPRSNQQRRTAVAAHQAARSAVGEAASHAALSAGDAAGSAYLHPFAKATQVRHILGASAHAARARELHDDAPDAAERVVDAAIRSADPVVLDVLRRYPPAPVGRTRVAELMVELDRELRRT